MGLHHTWQSISDQVIVMSHRPFRLIWKRWETLCRAALTVSSLDSLEQWHFRKSSLQEHQGPICPGQCSCSGATLLLHEWKALSPCCPAWWQIVCGQLKTQHGMVGVEFYFHYTIYEPYGSRSSPWLPVFISWLEFDHLFTSYFFWSYSLQKWKYFKFC